MTREQILAVAKPILFNTEMVLALLDDRKHVTRRVVKGYALEHLELDTDGSIIGVYDQDEGSIRPIMDYAPYRPGDLLYVRETWRVQSAHRFEADARIEFKAGGPMTTIQFPGRGSQSCNRSEYDAFSGKWADDKWHPSIHMSKEATRIFLRATDVRVERLLDSFTAQGSTIMALRDEGVDIGDHCRQCIENYGNPCCNDLDPSLEPDDNGEDENGGSECGMLDEVRSNFFHLWNSTIPKKDLFLYGWPANPWVWVIEFERVVVE